MSFSKKKQYVFDISHSDDKSKYKNGIYLNEMKNKYYKDIINSAKKQIRERLTSDYIEKKAKKGKGSTTLWSTKWLRKKIDSDILYDLILKDEDFLFHGIIPEGIKLCITKRGLSLHHMNPIIKIYASW